MAKGNLQISIPFDPVSFDRNAFNDFIRGNGTVLEHFKAIKCPIGKTDVNDPRSPHAAHDGCSNGYIYRCVGTVKAWFNNNSAMTSLSDVGILDGSVVQVTFPTNYDSPSEKEVSIMTHDRFYLKDAPVAVPHTQEFESSITGLDKLTYLIDEVEEIVDANGKEYGPGDYTIRNGQLAWTGPNRPPFNSELNKGTIVAIRYRYRAYFYCDRLMHEVRLINEVDFLSGERKAIRAPYAAVLKREYYFHNQENADSKFGDPSRAMIQPRDGTFSPR